MNSANSPTLPRRVVRLVGTGGMGVVYEAWDDRLERRVALKVLHPHLTTEHGHMDRLLREARLAARVEHQGVVRIYGIHECCGGLTLEMQYVEGIPLHRLLATRPFLNMQAIDLLRQVLEALAACHAQGVVHGDLKPGNLLVTTDGKVLLTDFGIARAFYTDSGTAFSSPSISGPLWGTPQYSPPEAFEGELPTPSWDLYALGVLVHEALAGSLPFNAHTPAVLMREKLQHAHDSIVEKRPDLSPEFARLIDSLKACDARMRPASAEIALDLLRQTPEFRYEAFATQPLTHALRPDPSDGYVSQPMGPYLPVIAAQPVIETPVIGRSWQLHAIWAGVLTISIAVTLTLGQYFRHRSDSDIAAISPMGSAGQVTELFVVDDTAYFSYDDGLRGRELWCAWPSGQVEMVADINPGPGSSNPRHFLTRPAGGFIFSAATSEHGEEPWFCGRGQWHSVWMLRDIIPGPMSSEPFPVGAWDLTFMFYATTHSQGAEPWLTTTLEGQTGILSDLCPGACDSRPKALKTAVDSSGAYLIVNGTEQRGWCLARYTYSDGTIAPLAEASEQTGEIVILRDSLFLAMPSDETGNELWMYTPGVEGLHLVADIRKGTESSNPQQLFVWKDRLYFQAATADQGKELWVSDGTAEGTVLLKNIAPGPEDGAPYGFVTTNNLLFFRANDASHGDELWVTDGTPSGTRLAFDLRPGQDSSNPYNIVALGNELFFSADDGAHGEELWKLDLNRIDTPPDLVDDLWPGPEGSEPHNLTILSGDAGIFVHKTPVGDALVRLEIRDGDIQLIPFKGLIRGV